MNKKKLILPLMVCFIALSTPAVSYALDYEYDEWNRVVKVTYDDGSYVTYVTNYKQSSAF